MKKALLSFCLLSSFMFCSAQAPGLPVTGTKTSSFKAPVRNETKLNALRTQSVLNETQLKAYLQDLMKQFRALGSNKKVVEQVDAKWAGLKDDARSQAWLVYWINKYKAEAVYAALKYAAEHNSGNLALNNIAALLNLNGSPEKAIPMLLFALTRSSTDPALLNNIGQSYYQLGDIGTSASYLDRCLGQQGGHAQANNTRGHIYFISGNRSAALDHYNTAMENGYNNSSAEQATTLEPGGPKGAGIGVLLQWPEEYPEPADMPKFQIPEIPVNARNNKPFVVKMKGELEGWENMIEEFAKTSVGTMTTDVNKILAEIKSKGESPLKTSQGPLHDKAMMAIDQLFREYQKSSDSLRKDLEKRMENIVCVPPDNCDDDCAPCRLDCESAFQARLNPIYRNYCTALWKVLKKYYGGVVFWIPYLEGPVESDGWDQVSTIAKTSLFTARTIVLSNIVAMYGIPSELFICDDDVEANPINKNVNFKKPECKPFIIPVGVLTLELGCDQLKLATQLGLVNVSYSRDFTTQQNTVSVGAGVFQNNDIINISGGAEVSVHFNDAMGVTDVTATGGASLGVSVGNQNVATVSAGAQVSIHSGSSANVQGTAVGVPLF